MPSWPTLDSEGNGEEGVHPHYSNLGPLHTQAKSRDHEIVRPKRKVSKANPRHFQIHVAWSQILKCSVKPYMGGSLTKCYVNEFLFTRVLTHDKTE